MRFARILSAVIALAALPAAAMEQVNTPPKFAIPFANSAGSAYVRSIPTTSQIGTQNCAASLTDGFPPLTFVPASAGGCPPFGQDFNGILKQLSQWSQWTQAGGPVYFDSGFAAAIGGYPKGAMIQSAVVPGNLWLSTADDNSTNPDAGGAGWVQAPGQVPIGTPVQSLSAAVPTGYVSANGLTIGNASSNATNRANADTQLLFSFVWSACPNAQCAIFTSTGAVSTRGATAADDYAANKALAVQNMNGLGLMGADSQSGTTSAFLTGVPATIGTRTVPGSILGENLHALVTGELAAHTHSITDPGHLHGITDPGHFHGYVAVQNVGSVNSGTGGATNLNQQTTSTTTKVTGITINVASTGITATNSTGSGTGHNTVERSIIVWWNLKL